MDQQIGRVLDALESSSHAKNTIIVLFSDHGFFLGEKERWAKQSLWERATRVPLVISVPDGLRGKVCARPVELLSLFPTLVELCGLPAKKDLEGESLVPLLKDPRAKMGTTRSDDLPAQQPRGPDGDPSLHPIRGRVGGALRPSDGSARMAQSCRPRGVGGHAESAAPVGCPARTQRTRGR